MIRRIVAVLSAGLIGLTVTGAAYFHDHKLIYGVGDYGASTQHYWVDASASAYAGTVDTAMSQWIYTTAFWGITTPISYTKTTVKSSSRMDHYKVSTINSWWGVTQWWTSTGQVDPSSVNWAWAKVFLDGDFVHCPNQRGVIAHEEGHAMGLAHITTGTAVMRADIGSLTITRAQPDDLNGINHLY